MNEWEPTPEAWDRFRTWLDPDPDKAGQKYESIRSKLIKVFARRGSNNPEELADEAINRVMRKLPEFAEYYEGEPAHYFFGSVVRFIHLESLRKNQPLQAPPTVAESERTEEECKCFDECIESLKNQDKDLILEYYQEEKGEKIKHRRQLAARFEMNQNELRIKACRIRMKLRNCVFRCLEENASDRNVFEFDAFIDERTENLGGDKPHD
jgi:hypothetical protein